MNQVDEIVVHHQAGDCRVVIQHGALQRAGALIRETKVGGGFTGVCAILTDSNVGPLYTQILLDGLSAAGLKPVVVQVPAGEKSKSLETVGTVIERLAEARLDRHSFLVALGGGVIGDLAGFVAAVYYRGIPHVQIPTTVISQCDSAIGGKTGVNTVNAKNLVGSFHPARLVLADPDVLKSLPSREFNEGFAEVIKHGAIADPAMLDRVRGTDAAGIDVIRRNLEIKARIVSADEFETNGRRAKLNFGHTIGHGIEQAAGYGRLLHGEAISLGLVAACRISARKAGLPSESVEKVIACLKHFDLPTRLPAHIDTDLVIASLLLDKKFQEGKIRFVLVPSLGQAFLTAPGEVTVNELKFAVEELRG